MPVWVRFEACALAFVVASSTYSAAAHRSDLAFIPPQSSESGDPVHRLLRLSDQSAPPDEVPEEGVRRRSLLLEMLAHTPRCYIADPTDEQLREILDRYRALPVAQVLSGQRFFPGGSAWAGSGSLRAAGQAARASLTYSFPADGVSWRDSGNGLNGAFTSHFGAGNLDRGREYARQALASWRRIAGLSYNEVLDTNIPFTNALTPIGGGDIRIGASFQGNSGVLAYNFYPDGGGDMSINIDQLTPGSMFNSNNNYRYLRNVIAHEHGHGLGYAHPVPCNQTKLMEPFASSAFEMTQIDEIRGAQRNYGDRFAGNHSAAAAVDFGTLTGPLRSVIHRSLSTNGAAGPDSTNQDWFRFSLGATQTVTITVAPTGGSYPNAQQDAAAGGCNPTTQPTVNASQAGNLNVELRSADGSTLLQQASAAGAGSTETLNASNLAPGTYTIRVIDVGPNPAANQVVQLYDLTVRLGSSRAAPVAIAGLNKRIAVGQTCFFMGDLNSRVTETGATLNAASYDWDLDGDGTFETLDTPQPSTVYSTPGSVNVTLRVTDSNGLSATDTITVYVGSTLPAITSVSPSSGQVGATVPVTIVGTGLSGVASPGQLTLSNLITGSGITVVGTPSVSPDGTTVTGLAFAMGISAAAGPRDLTITDADGTGQVAVLFQAFTVTANPPSNDECSAPIDLGSATGSLPFDNIAATTGAQQSFPGTGCPSPGPIYNDVWYAWTAPSNGNLNISSDSAVTGQPRPFNSRLAVYANNCPPGLPLGCNDFGASFNIFAAAGQTYLIQVGCTNNGAWGTGSINLVFSPILGACCDTMANCTSLPANACASPSVWQGAGTTCDLFPCDEPDGACCAPTGACAITDATGCAAGVFTVGAACTPNPCPQPTGACCAASGTCQVLLQAACDGGRTWSIGASCDPNPCAQPTGACCAPDGSCLTATQAECAGAWQGASSICSPNPCPQPQGACCAPDGACAITSQSACAGAWQGISTVCDPNPCPQPQGACCNATTCTLATQSACAGAGGVYQGNAVACGPAGNPTTCCPANFNLESGVTVQDIFDFLGAYFGGSPDADFNGAGGVTVQDIFDFLAAYFMGCP